MSVNTLYMVETMDPNDAIALREVTLMGGPSAIVDQAAAIIIREAIDLTGVTDPQAEMLADLQQYGHVAREHMPALVGVIDDLNDAETLSDAAYDALYDDEANEPTLNCIYDSLSTLENKELIIVRKDGLVVSTLRLGDGLQPAVYDDMEFVFGADSPEVVTAQTNGLTHFAYSTELGWKETADGSRPELRSERVHATLGTIAADGSFQPVTTVTNSLR